MPRGPKPFVIGGKCRQGHDLTGNNVRLEGTRVRCNICDNERKGRTGQSEERVLYIVGGKCKHGHDLVDPNTYIYPNGKVVCKTCRRNSNRKSLGLPEDNSPIETWAKGYNGKSHCSKGHELTEENTFIKSDGSKQCKICLEVNRFAARAKRYGLTSEELRSMIDNCGDGCQICREVTDDLVIDHNHETGKVRGLLCSDHNLMIGMARDRPEILRNAADYLDVYTLPNPYQLTLF